MLDGRGADTAVRRRVASPFCLALLVSLVLPPSAAAQTRPPGFPAPVLVAQTPEFAAVRAKWEGKAAAEITAAGYMAEPARVRASDIGLPAVLGNMDFHAVNPRLIRSPTATRS